MVCEGDSLFLILYASVVWCKLDELETKILLC